MGTFHPEVSDEDFQATAKKLETERGERRKTCTHEDYKGMEKHGRCCPNCGESMVDFGD